MCPGTGPPGFRAGPQPGGCLPSGDGCGGFAKSACQCGGAGNSTGRQCTQSGVTACRRARRRGRHARSPAGRAGAGSTGRGQGMGPTRRSHSCALVWLASIRDCVRFGCSFLCVVSCSVLVVRPVSRGWLQEMEFCTPSSLPPCPYVCLWVRPCVLHAVNVTAAQL
jgi:hypothetical protein